MAIRLAVSGAFQRTKHCAHYMQFTFYVPCFIMNAYKLLVMMRTDYIHTELCPTIPHHSYPHPYPLYLSPLIISTKCFNTELKTKLCETTHLRPECVYLPYVGVPENTKKYKAFKVRVIKYTSMSAFNCDCK